MWRTPAGLPAMSRPLPGRRRPGRAQGLAQPSPPGPHADDLARPRPGGPPAPAAAAGGARRKTLLREGLSATSVPSRAAAAARRGRLDDGEGREGGGTELYEPGGGGAAAGGVAGPGFGGLVEAGAAADAGLGEGECDAVGGVEVVGEADGDDAVVDRPGAGLLDRARLSARRSGPSTSVGKPGSSRPRRSWRASRRRVRSRRTAAAPAGCGPRGARRCTRRNRSR